MKTSAFVPVAFLHRDCALLDSVRALVQLATMPQRLERLVVSLASFYRSYPVGAPVSRAGAAGSHAYGA